jgi:protease I
MVIAPDQYRDEEFEVPHALFLRKGWTIDVASSEAGTARGMLGGFATVNHTLEDISGIAYDAVIVVGGMGSPLHLWDNATLHGILKNHASRDKVTAAICLSGAVLAKAGLLQGRRATVWEMAESLQALREGGATYTAEAVTVDGNLITANGPEAAEAFAHAVCEAVSAARVPA